MGTRIRGALHALRGSRLARLAFEHWGRGYTIEAAKAALDHGFGPLGLREVVSFTMPDNGRSRRVMERLGMRRSAADDFAHPNLAEGDRLRPHVLYRLSGDDWLGRNGAAP